MFKLHLYDMKAVYVAVIQCIYVCVIELYNIYFLIMWYNNRETLE